MTTNEPLLSVKEVAALLGVKKSWVYNNPGIPAVRIGHYLRFYWSDVKAYLETRRSAVLGMKRKSADIMRHIQETGEPVETISQAERLEHFEAVLLGRK